MSHLIGTFQESFINEFELKTAAVSKISGKIGAGTREIFESIRKETIRIK
jgi:hypothetical protein